MKQRGLILSCVMVFCLVVGVFSAGAAYNLTMDAMDANSEITTEFSPGSELKLNINLDAGSAGVAACAFTLEWTPVDALTPPTTDANGVSTGITSIFPFKTTVEGVANDTHRENSSVAGKIYFAGAEITAKGGSKTHPYDVTLFTASFTVSATASGSITFTLKQTELLNEAAGWGSNGVAAPVPIIVGAMPNDATQATWDATWVDGFDGDLSDDFPVRLASFATNPTLTVSAGPMSDYETWKIAKGYNNPDIGGPQDDYDNDGFTNDQERVNTTDPTADTADPVAAGVDVTNSATWAAMGSGYSALTDFRVSNLDVDNNGAVDLLTDGLLLIRRLAESEMGFDLYTDAEFIQDALGSGAQRNTASTIRAYIDAINEMVFDVDDSGKPTMLNDGTLIERRITERAMGFDLYSDAEFVADAVDTQYCARCEAPDIRAYIDQLFK